MALSTARFENEKEKANLGGKFLQDSLSKFKENVEDAKIVQKAVVTNILQSDSAIFQVKTIYVSLKYRLPYK